MAPLTRSGAMENLPHELMASYYSLLTGAGLIVTEPTAIHKDAQGHPDIPGIFNEVQINTWEQITQRLHQKAAKLFVQLVHVGRIGHIDNLPKGGRIVGVSSIPARGMTFTKPKQAKHYSVPEVLTTREVDRIIEDYVSAARNAIRAGFDGVELQGGNGYLMEQFLNPVTNNRTDKYGGSIENRSRFIMAVASKVSAAIGKNATGIRFTPFSTINDMPHYNPMEEVKTYQYLEEKLNALQLAYIYTGTWPREENKNSRLNNNNLKGSVSLHNDALDLREQLNLKARSDIINVKDKKTISA